jgi:hypothetical protein
MAWYWSDDVARAAIDAGLASERAALEWLMQPVAFAAEPGLELVDVAARLLGAEASPAAGAA